MRTRFLHCADIHLGYNQYNLVERGNDFARAFLAIVDTAIKEEVDFVILAGDLFHKRAIDALTLNQAVAGLERLQRVGIPCLAVEGNHERSYYDEYIGWMDFLSIRELLILLNPNFEKGKPHLSPFSRRVGSFYEPVPGVRVHGLAYSGSSTHAAIANYADALAEFDDGGVEYTIFMAHAGVEGVLADQAGGLSHRQLSVLKPHVDYLALGHIHKPFEHEEWIYNPGSPETCSVSEAAWPERGYYLVTVDTDVAEGESKHQAQLCANVRRPFYRIRLKTDEFNTPEVLYESCTRLLRRRAADLAVERLADDKRPVVELVLSGVLPFERSALEMAQLEEMVQTQFQPLTAQVRNLTKATEFSISPDARLNRIELERQIFTELLERDARYKNESESWAQLALSLKNLAIEGANIEAIIEEVAGAINQSAEHE